MPQSQGHCLFRFFSFGIHSWVQLCDPLASTPKAECPLHPPSPRDITVSCLRVQNVIQTPSYTLQGATYAQKCMYRERAEVIWKVLRGGLY